MEYWLKDFFREKRYLLVFLYFFSCIVVFVSINFVLEDLSRTNDSYYYYNDVLVDTITVIVLICLIKIFLIFVYKILFELKIVSYNIPMVNNLIMLVACWFVIALLIWYEFYFATMFYHGEVKVLSGYIIGSSILLAVAITVILSTRLKHVSILFFIFAILSYFFYECQLVILAQYIDVMSIRF